MFVFLDEHKQKEDMAKVEFERVLQEKDQLAKDLSDLERSFSSVVKRLDRCKEVIEGFKKVIFACPLKSVKNPCLNSS